MIGSVRRLSAGVAAAAAMIVLAAACSASLPERPVGAGSHWVEGTVRSTSGQPIADARVDAVTPSGEGAQLHEIAYGTDSAGHYRIPTLTGEIVIEVWSPGYQDVVRTTVHVRDGSAVVLDVTLVPRELAP